MPSEASRVSSRALCPGSGSAASDAGRDATASGEAAHGMAAGMTAWPRRRRLSRRLLRLLHGLAACRQRLERLAAPCTARSASTLRSMLDAGLVEAVDKSAVGHAVLAHRRVDALDPQSAERALLALAVAIVRTAAPSRPPAWRRGSCSCAGRNSPWRPSELSCAWRGR